MSDSPEFKKILSDHLGDELSPIQIDRVVAFREEVLKENAIQNLTRLLSPQDFFDGHVLDVVHLQRSGFLELPALDLGAGMGVPGLLHALIYTPEGSKTWISSDSEGMKTEFMRRMIDFFKLSGVSARATRGEEILDTESVNTVVARAVGTVSKIYGWLRTRSTWNTLILFKGPKWDEEWVEFEKSSHRGRLVIEQVYEYRVGAVEKRLKMIKLRRK